MLKKKILVIRLSSIGDIVLTTPVLRCIKKSHPDCELHFLTKPSYLELVSHSHYVDKSIGLKSKISETISELKEENYSYIIDLHHNLRTLAIKYRLGKTHYSFPKKNIEKWLFVNTKINRMPSQHIVSRYFETVKKLNVINDGLGLEIVIPDSSIVSPSEFNINSPKFVTMAIGGKFATKKMPKEKLSEICSVSSSQFVLLGGKEDFEVGEYIRNNNADKVINLCGKLTLLQSASIIKQSSKLITHDTGMMHIGAALKKPIVSIWGSTVPEFGMYPYYGNENISHFISQVSPLYCRPCSKIGFDECPAGHFKCMKNQNISAIVDFLNA